MAAETLLVPTSSEIRELQDWASVFTFRATKGERVVMELYGLQDPDTPSVRVLALIRNVRATEERPPVETLHTFPDREHATRFADEAIVCFEYLGCVVTD